MARSYIRYEHVLGRPARSFRAYRSYIGILSRCFNKRDPLYKDYGGRGIQVCESWSRSFINFLKDMGERPKGLSIDRIDNDGNYEPENCRWATIKQQIRNRRCTVVVEWDGKPVCLGDLCDQKEMPRDLIYRRMIRGWSLEKAISTPKGPVGFQPKHN